MIYFCHGLKSNQLNTYDNHLSDFDMLAGILEQTQKENRTPVKTDHIQEYKTAQATYIIAGELNEPIRKTENMESRSLLFLDLDDIEGNENQFINNIKRIDNLNFIAYPTISHNIKGTRYRLILDIDRPITTAKEYSELVELFTRELYENVLKQEEYNLDISNQTWAQLQGWYIKTEANKDSPILTHTSGKAIEVDKMIKHITETPQTTSKSVSDGYQYHSSGQASTLAQVAPIIFNGTLEEGNRHNFFIKASCAVIKGCGDDKELLKAYLVAMEDLRSSRCFPPFPPKEYEKCLIDASKKVNRKV